MRLSDELREVAKKVRQALNGVNADIIVRAANRLDELESQSVDEVEIVESVVELPSDEFRSLSVDDVSDDEADDELDEVE